MYEIGGADRVHELDNLPLMDTGSPEPRLHAEAGTVAVRNRLSERDPRHAHATDGLEPCATIVFVRCLVHAFGYPNDAALNGHPLHARGLSDYGLFEIFDSSWIRLLTTRNRVHSMHRDDMFAEYRHFIVTFHDQTFECIAGNFRIE